MTELAKDGSQKFGILLVNLGSPAAATTKSVRQFLREFLGDPRVVNLPRPLWWLILNCFILPFRPGKSLKAYRKIWTQQGSPLIVLTRQLAEQVAKQFVGQPVVLDYAMRYGQPTIASRLQTFKQQQINNIIVLPLYPQYSSTTTASVYDDLIKEFKQWRHLPSFHFISDYHQHPGYIAAVAASIQQVWQQQGRGDFLLMSFHGLPAQLTKWGDPYFYQCQQTAALVAKQLGLQKQQWQLVFQSRFGKAEWLKPYCVEVLAQLPARGFKDIDVVCPGFAVDCLETLEEIAMENKAVFLQAGGENYHYIPALNASAVHVGALTDILKLRFNP